MEAVVIFGALMAAEAAPLPTQLGSRGVISPHLDDAVLSCSGAFFDRTLVVTVFASGPSRVETLSPWDQASGLFAPGDDIYAARTAEDDEALATLGAVGHRLQFWDIQYRETGALQPSRFSRLARRLRPTPEPSHGELEQAVLSELSALIDTAGVSTWFAPLGICHPDHRILGRVLPALIRRHPEVGWHVYDDLPYSLEAPRDRDKAHAQLKREGFSVEPITGNVDRDRKRAAINCYRSQIVPLAGRDTMAVEATEHLYRLSSS